LLQEGPFACLADATVKFAGGIPLSTRFNTPPLQIPEDFKWGSFARSGYGNGSTADYFAEAFAWSIYNPEVVPCSLSIWVGAIVSLTQYVVHENSSFSSFVWNSLSIPPGLYPTTHLHSRTRSDYS
jgi:hypothetical protein